MGFILFFLLFLLLFALFIIYGSSQQNKNVQNLKRNGFNPNFKIMNLLIDENSGLWCINGMNSTLKLSEITDCEIIEDGVSYKPDNGVLRAVVGGALFGGAGAIVGALTASTSESVNRLEVVIHTNNPTLLKSKVVLLSSPTKRSSSLYQSAKNNAETLISCLDRLSGFSSKKNQTAASIQNSSVIISNADELAKYKELLDKGAISEEEYDAVKKRLLNL